MSTPDYQILQAARDWALDVLGFTTDADKRKVILDQKGLNPDGTAISAPSPDVPYLVIALTAFDIPAGTDDQWVDSGGNKQFSGDRSGTLTIHGYGLETNGWLTTLTLRYTESPTLSLVPRPGMTALHEVADGDYRMAHYVKEFELAYKITAADDYEVDVAESADVDMTYNDTFTDTIVEDL